VAERKLRFRSGFGTALRANARGPSPRASGWSAKAINRGGAAMLRVAASHQFACA